MKIFENIGCYVKEYYEETHDKYLIDSLMQAEGFSFNEAIFLLAKWNEMKDEFKQQRMVDL